MKDQMQKAIRLSSEQQQIVRLGKRVHNLEQCLIMAMILVKEGMSPGQEHKLNAIMEPYYTASKAAGGFMATKAGEPYR